MGVPMSQNGDAQLEPQQQANASDAAPPRHTNAQMGAIGAGGFAGGDGGYGGGDGGHGGGHGGGWGAYGGWGAPPAGEYGGHAFAAPMGSHLEGHHLEGMASAMDGMALSVDTEADDEPRVVEIEQEIE